MSNALGAMEAMKPRSSRFKPGRLDGHVDLARLGLDLVRLDGPDRGQAERASRSYIETRTVPRTLDFVVLEVAGREREVPVRTVVLDRVDLALRVGQADPRALD